MMGWIITNFQTFSSVYTNVCIEIYLVLVSVLFAYWLRPFTRIKRSGYIAALIYYCLTTLNTHLVDDKDRAGIIAVGIIVVTIIALWLLDEKRNPVQKIFLCIVFRLISWLSIEIFSEIGFYERDFVFRFELFRSDVNAIVLEFIAWSLFEYSLALLLLYVALRLLHKAYRNKAEDLTLRELAILIIPSWSLLLVKPIIRRFYELWMDGIANGSIKENIPGNPYNIMFCICSYFSVLVIIILYQKIKDQQEKAFIKESLDRRLEDMQRHIESTTKYYEQMRAMSHDMGNHISVIEGLARAGNTGELIDYISELHGRFEGSKPVIKSGNAVTDIILSEAADQCKKKNIIFDSRFSYPNDLDINPFDMSVVLSNALQNAMEASEELKDPLILVTSMVRGNVFILSVKNRMKDKLILNEEGIPDSSKNDSGHGYGLKNIRSIAARYKGDIEIKQESRDGYYVFVLNVMMIG